MSVNIPAQTVPISVGGGPVNPVWYDKLKYLEKLTPYAAPADTTAARLIGNPSAVAAQASEISLGTGLAFSGTTLKSALSTLSNVLGADVALNNTSNYFDGPSVAQGTTGTWLAIGTVTVSDTAVGTNKINVKLWDGTTVVASTNVFIVPPGGITAQSVSLCGIFTSPAGNIRISANDATTTTGKILFNGSGNSKDSNITAIRIA